MSLAVDSVVPAFTGGLVSRTFESTPVGLGNLAMNVDTELHLMIFATAVIKAAVVLTVS